MPPPDRATRPVRTTRAALAAIPGAEALAEHSQLFGLVRRALTRALSSERTSALGQKPATAEERRRFREEGLPLLAAELRRLEAATRADGASLAVVFVPFRQGVYGDAGWWADELRWKSSAIAAQAAQDLAGRGVPFLDLTPALVARARSGPPLYHAGEETHPTPRGYRAIADEVAAWLRRSPALTAPPPTAP